MSNSRNRKIQSIVVLLVLAAAVVSASLFVESEGRKISPTSYSNNGLGLSVFYAWLSETHPQGLRRIESALLNNEQLAGQKGYVLFSPEKPVSDLKQKVLDEFVKKGGTLYLSAHNDVTLEMLKPLLAKFSLQPNIEPNPDFKNGEPAIVRGTSAMGDLAAETDYAFYSLWRFKSCRQNHVECFAVQAHHFEGQVYLYLGLPPIANGLLFQGQNYSLATSVAKAALPLVVDEFDHRFSNRELSDLMVNPTFAFPAAGMLLAFLLFMFLGEHKARPVAAQRAIPDVGSFHQTGRGVVAEAVAAARGRGPSLNFLSAALGRRAKRSWQVSSKPLSRADFLERASKLVNSYKIWLESKRKVGS